MQTALITNAASYADSAGRGHLLLIIILVLAGLIIGFLLLAAIGVGVTKGLGALYKVAFPGSLGFLWIVAIIATAAIAFVFAIGWLWIVAAVLALMVGLGYAAKDND